MGQERPEWLAAKLTKYVQYTTHFLHEVTETNLLGVDEAGRDIVKLAAMPKSAVVHSQGLAFVQRRKVGALVSCTRERVILVRKIVAPDGAVAWSGPIFLRGRSFGLGITAGSMNMRMCLAIMNEKGMESVLRPHHNAGLNFSFLVDMNGSAVRRVQTSSSGMGSQVLTGADGGMIAKYYLLDAGIIDISVRGGSFRLDEAMNQTIYGKGVDLQDVLQGRLDPPKEFQPVYDMLAEFGRDARTPHTRLSTMHDRSSPGSGGGASGGGGSGGGSTHGAPGIASGLTFARQSSIPRANSSQLGRVSSLGRQSSALSRHSGSQQGSVQPSSAAAEYGMSRSHTTSHDAISGMAAETSAAPWRFRQSPSDATAAS